MVAASDSAQQIEGLLGVRTKRPCLKARFSFEKGNEISRSGVLRQMPELALPVQNAGYFLKLARMLHKWNEGVAGLREARVFNLPGRQPGASFEGFSEPPKLDNPKRLVAKSEGLANRKKRRLKQ